MSESVTDTAFNSGTPAGRVSEFAGSEHFARLFRDGMDMVEETASYLDGPGREDAKAMGRAGALAYAAESMKLTTRLMQAASWLLAQRQVAEGDLSPDQLVNGQYRLPADDDPEELWPADGDIAPGVLADLAGRSRQLYARLKRIDESLFDGAGASESGSPVGDQLNRLMDAFGQ
ncbi:DUF1465 family protein [Hyphobacterium sp. HN65]|uniref:DUF1465 family protein n=1 Tax=Hyphobacterium lacteum TaxID=3116575 RepID=A0ABU7LNW8_9PROT|nr:DUF1465 family protein [Hyphobacterium sp. HN65]MEE2525602.1 DUF1465 family protein [Hyphobacterium sp. HN65]